MRQDYLIMGRGCLEEVLKHCPERLKKVFAQRSSQATRQRADSLMEKLEARGTPVKEVSKDELFRMVESDSHQGFVAVMQAPKNHSLQELVELGAEKERSLILMLDSINDPQNFGALLRVAVSFGVTGVIYSKNRGCQITPVVTKASVGASELVNLCEVSNLAESLRRLQKEAYDVVVADCDPKAVSSKGFNFPKQAVLVMGSEGSGPQPLIKKLADHTVYIPMQGPLQSLNVSQAASILLYQAL